MEDTAAIRLRRRLMSLDRAEEPEFALRVQLRSRHEAAAALVRRVAPDEAEVRFEAAQRAVTPGQSAVFYDGDVVLGGGIVADSVPATALRARQG